MSKVYALLVGLRITRHSKGKSHKFQWTVLPLPPTCNIKRGSGQGGHIRLHSQVHLIRATATFRCLQRGFSSPSARMIFLASLSFVWHIFHVYQLKWMRSLIRPAVAPTPHCTPYATTYTLACCCWGLDFCCLSGAINLDTLSCSV